MDGVKSLSKFAIPEDNALPKDWSVDVNFCNVKVYVLGISSCVQQLPLFILTPLLHQ